MNEQTILEAKTFWQKIDAAFKSQTVLNGYSARKLSAFTITGMIVIVHIWWLRHSYRTGEFQLLPDILLYDYGFISIALGLTTIEQLTKLKNGDKKNDTPNTPAV